MDSRRAFCDRPYLRASPHGDEHEGRRTAKLGFHRGAWSSNVYSQTKWWAPSYSITAGRTIAFYPEYWQKPLKNTSADWDLEESGPARTPRGARARRAGRYRFGVADRGRVRRLLCLSGAHLHASVPKAAGVARFSVEVRTADEMPGRGAGNLDGDAPRVALDWYRNVMDGVPVPAAVHKGG